MNQPGAAAAHLRALGAEPRPTGTDGAAEARAYCGAALGALGFRVHKLAFEYSALPGEYGTPLGGLAALAVLSIGVLTAGAGHPLMGLVVLVATVPVLVAGGSWLARHGVLALRVLRRRGVNIEAVRGTATPKLWLVAHVDSKSQPVPLLARAAGIIVLGAAWLAAALVAAAASAGVDVPTSWWRWALLAGIAGALPVVASVVGRRSPGAIDNASGVATVLAAASELPVSAPVGVLITDAEELGLAGARAWCVGRERSVALNCDGVDDAGTLTVMWTRPRSLRLERALRLAAAAEREPLRIIPLIPGVLVDGVAFADSGWEVITVSRGTLGTLRKVHTTADNMDALRGEGAAAAARVLARAAMSLVETV